MTISEIYNLAKNLNIGIVLTAHPTARLKLVARACYFLWDPEKGRLQQIFFSFETYPNDILSVRYFKKNEYFEDHLFTKIANSWISFDMKGDHLTG